MVFGTELSGEFEPKNQVSPLCRIAIACGTVIADGFETTSVGAFVQQVAAHCLPHGYRYYVSGLMPEGKDYRAIDARIIAKYEIAKNRWARYRRKRAGEVNIRYLRYGRRFLLLATGPWGRHRFFESEVEIRDMQAVPIRFHGYELSYRGGRVWVQIGADELAMIRERLLRRAVRARVSELVSELQSLPYEPYRSVRYQLFGLLREVNRRKAAGLACVPEWAIPARRTSFRVFQPAVVSESRSSRAEFSEKPDEQAKDTAEVNALG